MYQLDLSNTDERLFPRMLAQQARHNSDTLFLVTDEQQISFADSERITQALATGLKLLGVTRGDRVALYMSNRPEMVLMSLAVNKLGAIWTPINTDYKGQWLLDSLNSGLCKLLVVDEEFAAAVAAIRSQLNIDQIVLLGDDNIPALAPVATYAQLAATEARPIDYSAQHYGDTCAILWTSGTTGKSKGVMQSYNSWIRAITCGASKQYNSRPGDVIYCVLPLFNTAAWITCIYRALIEGLPCVIEKKFSVSQFWDRVRHFGATQTFALGAMGVFLMNAPEQADDATTPMRSLSIIPMPPKLWKPFEQRFGVTLNRTGLGMSECQCILTQVENRDDVPVYALGFPLDDTEIKLCDDAGLEVTPGEPGEICIRPLQPFVLFNGYFNNPQATATAYRGEFFLTGDMARQDPATGAYFYVDRKKDAVRFAGRNISTLEVESVARQHPAVQDVAAFGIASAEIDSEQELKLNIVLKPEQTLTPESLCQFIHDNAPRYFVPRYIEFVSALLYTPTNKVQKYLLRDAGVTAQTWDRQQSSWRPTT